MPSSGLGQSITDYNTAIAGHVRSIDFYRSKIGLTYHIHMGTLTLNI